MTRKLLVLLAIGGVLVVGIIVAGFSRVSDQKWVFQRLICRRTSVPTSVSNIQWQRDDLFRLGIIFNLGERVFRGSFSISVEDFDQLQARSGFTAFKGDFVPGGTASLPGWFLPDPQARDYEIFFRDIGQGQEFLWRRPGQTNACYLLFDI